jgi:hypothetical protein
VNLRESGGCCGEKEEEESKIKFFYLPLAFFTLCK